MQRQFQVFKSTAAAPPSQQQGESRETYNVAQNLVGTDACARIGLNALGITGPTTIHRNLTFQELFEHEQANIEGKVAAAANGDTFTVYTGKYTGRSPKDKWVVYNEGSQSAENVDWNDVNRATTPAVFDELYDKAVAHFNSLERAYVLDCYCGASPKSRKKIRFVLEMAWQQHFVSNMFIRPQTSEELENFEPDFTVINCCSQIDEDWERHNLNSETAVVFNIEKGKAVVFGSWYGGENKKGIFSLMNYWLPLSDPPQLPMHCSANVGKDGDVALFFGLSGTGKTTLSADPHRALIGDDEHGWDEDGIYNFEGGCYAKTINLSEATEPDIYHAIRTDALLENVVLTGENNVPDYFDTSITENGRVSYPIFHIPGYVSQLVNFFVPCAIQAETDKANFSVLQHQEQMAGHPENIIFLSCDAFGVLPPVAKLTPGQAMYHFMSGYTAKVAGTERGITEPVATFSTCFGAAFMTLHPTVYADLLAVKMEQHGTHTYLVNSGWAGGPYGEGKRMSINTTRTCIDAILDGSIQHTEFIKHPIFGFDVPLHLDGVDSSILDIRSTWSDPKRYDEQAKKLANMFIENFKKYEGKGSVDYTSFGPQI